jgi:hypothetical protein
MLNDAASCDQLAAAQWLSANGAPWPVTFRSHYTNEHDEDVEQCWSVSAVQWAIAASSGWREWDCDDYAADLYKLPKLAQQATELLEWAHANGCPCTCGHQQQQQQ